MSKGKIIAVLLLYMSMHVSMPNKTDGLLLKKWWGYRVCNFLLFELFPFDTFCRVLLPFILVLAASPLAACSPTTAALAPSVLDNKYTYI